MIKYAIEITNYNRYCLAEFVFHWRMVPTYFSYYIQISWSWIVSKLKFEKCVFYIIKIICTNQTGEDKTWTNISDFNDKNIIYKVCQRLVAFQWFSPDTPVSSTNKTDCLDITEILLKGALKHHNPNPYFKIWIPNSQ